MTCELCHDVTLLRYCDFCKSLVGRDARLGKKYKKTSLAIHLCKISRNHPRHHPESLLPQQYPRPYCAPKVTRSLYGLRRRHESMGHDKSSLLTEDQLCHKLENTGVTTCWYCGDNTRTGLDRVDNSQGYSDANSVACCFRCNFLKADHSVSLFLDKMKKITCNEN